MSGNRSLVKLFLENTDAIESEPTIHLATERGYTGIIQLLLAKDSTLVNAPSK
jgi:Na+-translocating ferredoxin:NAD+ oxidoreductase RnfG subunit